MTFGFNDNNEKVEVNPKSDSYTKAQTATFTLTNAGANRVQLFGNNMELWTWRGSTIGNLTANEKKYIEKVLPAELFEGITNPDEECAVFITPKYVGGGLTPLNVSMFAGNFTVDGGGNWTGLRIALINNEAEAINGVKADILIIKQLPQS